MTDPKPGSAMAKAFEMIDQCFSAEMQGYHKKATHFYRETEMMLAGRNPMPAREIKAMLLENRIELNRRKSDLAQAHKDNNRGREIALEGVVKSLTSAFRKIEERTNLILLGTSASEFSRALKTHAPALEKMSGKNGPRYGTAAPCPRLG